MFDMARALQCVRVYPGPADESTYLFACNWLVKHMNELTETVAILFPEEVGLAWWDVAALAVGRMCGCGRTRLLVPPVHRPFLPGTGVPLLVPARRDADVLPLGGTVVTSLADLHWLGGIGHGGRLKYASSDAESDTTVTETELRQGMVPAGGLIGFPLVTQVDGVKVPLALITGINSAGLEVVPDAAMRLFRSDDQPGLPSGWPGCTCLIG